MPNDLAAALLHAALGLQLGPADPGGSNRVACEGLSIAPGAEGMLEIRVEKVELSTLWLGLGPLRLEVGALALRSIVAHVRMDAGQPSLHALTATQARLSGAKANATLAAAGHAAKTDTAAGAWSLGPLAAADGTLRAQIVDAHLVFDADVTVPIRAGQVEFRNATVEHVGPDSRMGVSRLGLYVDAPNGRSYLYQFSSAPVDGVEYERRGALLGPWVTDRGRLRLQPFGESLLRQAGGPPALCFTEQARMLFQRTALSGDLQLGDGRFAVPGFEAGFTGRQDSRNLVRVHSEAVGRGLTLEMPALSLRDATLGAGDGALHADEITGSASLRVYADGTQWRLALDLASLELSGLRSSGIRRGPRREAG